MLIAFVIFSFTLRSSQERGGGDLRKADLIFIVFFIQNKGFWNLILSRLHKEISLRIGQILSCYGGHRTVVHVENTDNILFSDDLIVTGVKIHAYLPITEKRRPRP